MKFSTIVSIIFFIIISFVRAFLIQYSTNVVIETEFPTTSYSLSFFSACVIVMIYQFLSMTPETFKTLYIVENTNKTVGTIERNVAALILVLVQLSTGKDANSLNQNINKENNIKE
jgi:hypothetical protein